MSLEIVDLCAAGCGSPGDENSHRGKPWCGRSACYLEINRILARERREDEALTDGSASLIRPVTEADRVKLAALFQKIRLESSLVLCDQAAKEIAALAIEGLTVIGGVPR